MTMKPSLGEAVAGQLGWLCRCSAGQATAAATPPTDNGWFVLQPVGDGSKANPSLPFFLLFRSFKIIPIRDARNKSSLMYSQTSFISFQKLQIGFGLNQRTSQSLPRQLLGHHTTTEGSWPRQEFARRYLVALRLSQGNSKPKATCMLGMKYALLFYQLESRNLFESVPILLL